MRKELTKQEATLWVVLKAMRADGFHWRKQAPFRGYYLDFVCFSRRLVVEADGTQHDGPVQKAHDEVRDRVLRREGFKVLRFRNGDIDADLDGVRDLVVQALTHLPHPDPLRGSVPPHEGEG